MLPPLASGHTGFGTTGLQRIVAAQAQVEQVEQFNAQPRDFSAPRMQFASSLPAAPLANMQTQIDIRV